MDAEIAQGREKLVLGVRHEGVDLIGGVERFASGGGRRKEQPLRPRGLVDRVEIVRRRLAGSTSLAAPHQPRGPAIPEGGVRQERRTRPFTLDRPGEIYVARTFNESGEALARSADLGHGLFFGNDVGNLSIPKAGLEPRCQASLGKQKTCWIPESSSTVSLVVRPSEYGRIGTAPLTGAEYLATVGKWQAPGRMSSEREQRKATTTRWLHNIAW